VAREAPKQLKWNGETVQSEVERASKKPQANTILNELNQFMKFAHQFTTIKEEITYTMKGPINADNEDDRHRHMNPHLLQSIRLWNFLTSLKTFGGSNKRKKRRRYGNINYSGEEKVWKDLVRKSSIRDNIKWPEFFEDFITASLIIIATITFSMIYFSKVKRQSMNIFEEIDEPVITNLQFLQNHQQFFRHNYYLNSEAEQMTNKVNPYFTFSSRSVPDLLDHINIICPGSREVYLTSTKQENEDTQQGKQWEVMSYQFPQCTHIKWLFPILNQFQTSKSINEAPLLNHSSKIKATSYDNIPEEDDQPMRISDLSLILQNHQAVYNTIFEAQPLFTPADLYIIRETVLKSRTLLIYFARLYGKLTPKYQPKE
jgi:hypothetical protein